MTSKKRSQLEAHLEKKCVNYAKAFGYDSVKLDNAKRKWPDRLFVGSFDTFFVEFKQPGEKPRPQQSALIKWLEINGQPVFVIDDFDDFTDLLVRRHNQFGLRSTFPNVNDQ